MESEVKLLMQLLRIRKLLVRKVSQGLEFENAILLCTIISCMNHLHSERRNTSCLLCAIIALNQWIIASSLWDFLEPILVIAETLLEMEF